MDVVNFVQHVVFGQDNVVETHTAWHFKRRLQTGQALDRGIGLDKIVALKNGHAATVLHWDNGTVEPAIIPRMRCTLLRQDGVLVDVLAGPSRECGNGIGANPLRYKARFNSKFWITRHGATVRPHGDTRHRFDAACDHQIFPSRCDLLCRDIHCLQAGSAEAIQLNTGNRFIPLGILHDHLRHIRTLLTDG